MDFAGKDHLPAPFFLFVVDFIYGRECGTGRKRAPRGRPSGLYSIDGLAATRTRDLLLRRQSLYPPELQALSNYDWYFSSEKTS